MSPSAPRAMLGPTKDEVEFSSKFNLLSAFGSFHTEPEVDDLDSVMDDVIDVTGAELLQGWLNGMSYLCDIEKGGATVTAAVLGHDNILYIAANNDISSTIQTFIRGFVFRELENSNSGNRHDVAEKMLREAIKLAKRRMEFYFRQFRHSWNECRPAIDDQFRGTSLFSWIETLATEQDYYNLAVQCYEARLNQLVELKAAASDREDWMRLIHYIGRLGAHKYHVSKILSAFSKLPVLRNIERCFFVPSFERRDLVLPDTSNFAMLGKKVSDDLERPAKVRRGFFLSLMDKWYVPGSEKSELQTKLDQNKKLRTRVHAELVLLNYLKRNKIRFYDDYEYIGCSKPACYFCYHWIKNEGLIPPRSHFTIHLECRGPDFSGSAEKVRERLYGKLCKQIAEDIHRKMSDPIVPDGKHFQSSNGSHQASRLTSSLLSEPSSRL